MAFLLNNFGTIIVGAVVLGVAVLIVFKHFKSKKEGKSSCSSSCANCPYSGKCH